MQPTRTRQPLAVIGIPFLIVSIVVVMVVPLPAPLLDLLLSTNFAMSVLILVTAMVIREDKHGNPSTFGQWGVNPISTLREA